MRIALDAMGGDHAPACVVDGALQALAALNDVDIVLFGDERRVRDELARRGADLPVVHTSDVIGMDESPIKAVRRKRDASVCVAARLVGDGRAHGFVTAGNTGAAMAIAKMEWGAIPGVERMLQRYTPRVWDRLNHQRDVDLTIAERVDEHVVVLGYGRVGQYVVNVLGHLDVPRLVVEMDAARVDELERDGVPVLMGDAANPELLKHAGLGHARALVVTLPDDAAAEIVVAAAMSVFERALQKAVDLKSEHDLTV